MVEADLPDIQKTPVLNGLLVANNQVKVNVSLTASLGDSVPEIVTNAQVIIRSETECDTLSYTGDGWYSSKLIASEGQTYYCTVDIPDFPQMSAQTTVPEISYITDVKYTALAGFSMMNEKISSFELTILNNPAKELFWDVQFNGIYYPDYYFKAEEDSVFLTEAEPLNIFSNRMMKTADHKLKLYTTASYVPKGDYSIELRSVDSTYYKYQKQLYLYYSGGYRGFGTSSQTYPLYTNVKNGSGIFTSYTPFFKIHKTLSD